MLPAESIQQLKTFVDIVKKTPHILLTPQLKFFKEFIESYGGRVPTLEETFKPGTQIPSFKPATPPPTATEETTEEENEESTDESDIELDCTGVIEKPDVLDNSEEASLDETEVTEEVMDKADEKKREAIRHYADGEYEKALVAYNEAIKLNPRMSLLYAKRGQCNLQMMKPNACIRDCSLALQLNPDNAAAYKFRGRAHRLLGNWLQAAQDLRSACKIDFDEQADEWLKEVTPNAKKLEEHQRKYERMRKDKELKKRREEYEKRQKANQAAAKGPKPDPMFSMPEADDGMGMGIPKEMMDMFKDPEIAEMMKDPEIMAAFAAISADPSKMMSYTANPKVMAFIEKMTSKMGGPAGAFNADSFGGGMGGAMGGGMGNGMGDGNMGVD